uniref:Polycystin 1 like 1, transient receptor potential channel interacting n=1 Tax=Kryptolebias marmoratus TaxID=37003 RepID=A0A3Q3GA85_KRYMA
MWRLQVAVGPVVADLTLNICDNQLTATDDVSAELLRLTLQAECNAEGDCNHGNVTNRHRRGSILSHLDAHHPLRASDPSSCHLLLRLHLRLPSAGGQSPELTTEEWTITVSPPNSGLYSVTVRVFSPVRRSRVLLQEPAGDVLQDDPRGIAAKQQCSVSLRVAAGSNVTVSPVAAELHRNSSCLAGAEATAVLLSSHIREVVIELRAENRASSQSKSVRMCVEGKRKPQDQIHSSWQPLTCQSPTYSKEDKGKEAKNTIKISSQVVKIYKNLIYNQSNHDYFQKEGFSSLSCYTLTLKSPFYFAVVRICATKQVQPTNTDITFVAVADTAHPAELFWDFGDSRSARTSSRIITKRYQNPGSYDVVVAASWGQAVVVSDVFAVLVQRAVELSRLVHRASVLKNQTVTVSCRVNAGTDLTFAWSFGDGATRSGQRTVRHVFNRTGEFTIKVVVSNLISSASLSSLIFVVDRPCQPPPVKNMGPLRLQVWRFEVVRLGVTFESDVECDVSGGLRYSWTLLDSAGRDVPLPLGDKQKQILVLPSHALQYNTYTATARVQVFGSVVYSNYTVRLQVMPSPPVALIQGGTNIFINKKNTELISLNGRASYDPDFPQNPLSYSWTCKPVSAITTSCYNQDVPTSSPELQFPISLLKDSFDQFQFRLTVHSGERSSSSETFLTVTPDPTGTVSVHCDQCRGDGANWDQPFSVAAACADCEEPVQFTWSLYLVNASSKTASEGKRDEEPRAEGRSVSGDLLNILRDKKYHLGTLFPCFPSDLSNSEPSTSPRLHSDPTDLSPQTSDFLSDSDSSADWEEYFPLLESPDAYDAPFPAEEGDPGMSAGRPSGSWRRLGDSGANSARPSPSPDRQRISSSLLRFKPFSLKPKTQYLLEVTAKSRQSFLGRTQLFVKTSPAPEGVTCQVQPAEGAELHTHFSVFCASGRQDLLYKYSFSARGNPPRILYQGRDFQYYFNLPSGDPSDDYKVTIYTEIRSGRYGSATRPCPVTVRVKPSFVRDNSSSSPHPDPDLKLSESGLQTLSALLQLGNSAEVRNHVSLLCSVLNRLSRGTEAEAQRRLRNALICTVCELESSDQVHSDLQTAPAHSATGFTELFLVTLMSIRRVTSHVQAVSEQFSEVITADSNHRLLDSLISLLSYTLQAVSSCDSSPETLSGELESESSTDHNEKGSENAPDCCLTHSTCDHFKHVGSIPIKQVLQLVGDILQTASDLMLVRRNIQLSTKELIVNSGLVTLHAASQNQTSTTIRSNLTTVDLPESLIHAVFVRLRGRARLREPNVCVLRVLVKLSRSPYCWASYPAQLTGPVVDLSLYKCSTRRRIHVGSLPQPISFELHHPQTNRSSVSEYSLLRGRINYHNFSISQELLHQAVQVTVVFTPPPTKEFPIMLLFRMFERPTPSMHHLQRIHKWESDTVRITLPPSYFNAAGVGHLALLDANFGKASRRKRKSEQISYGVSVDSSLCLSWDGQQGDWTHHSCRTQRLDTSVNCSCFQLRPLTVFQQQIPSSHDTADLDQFLSVSSNLTVFSLLMLVLILFIPGLMWTQRADVVSEEHRRVHFLSDNNPEDSYLYAVCIHTGLRSAACMTAKVFIVLCGELGLSQTKELQAPGCTLFRRNAQDTFMLSAAGSLGTVWGVHIWHNNSGPSPDWYIKHVMVSEVSSGQVGRSWLFVGESWLAVNEDDGQVERMLHVGGLGFARMLSLRFSDYLADFHTWISVYSCRWPNSFTHTQRLGVCLLLLSGYAAVNAVIVAQTDDQLESGIVGVSVVSITAGLLSVVIVLPAATLISFLFRLCGIKPTGSGVQHGSFRMTAKQDSEGQDTDMLSVSTTLENKDTNEEPVIQAKRRQDSVAFGSSRGPSQGLSLTSEGSYCEGTEGGFSPERDGFGFQKTTRKEGQTFQNKRHFGVTSMRCLFLAWALCLLISLLCLVLSASLGFRFSSSQVLLWIQSLFVSLISCIFFIQPALVTMRVCSARIEFLSHSNINLFLILSCSELVRGPATSASCARRQKERLLSRKHSGSSLCACVNLHVCNRNLMFFFSSCRDLSVCAAMLLLMTCINYYSSFKEHYQLNRAVKRHFLRNQGFISIKTHKDWWKWTQTALLDLLDQNKSDKTEPSYVGIGDLVIKKTETYQTSQNQVVCKPPLMLSVFLCSSDAASELELLRSSGWVGGQTVALKVQFTLYSPAPNLFTGVTLLSERSPSGVLRPSVKVQSVRVDAAPAGWDHVVTLCQLLFLLLSLLQLCNQVSTATQKGLMGYWRTPSTWLDVSLNTPPSKKKKRKSFIQLGHVHTRTHTNPNKITVASVKGRNNLSVLN